jgi:TonB-linked SusC/RagA family outer membrane protein
MKIMKHSRRKRMILKLLVPKLLLLIGISLCLSVSAQNISIRGRVTSVDDGSSLPGVSVVIKGTTTGTITNADGIYELSAPGNSALVFTFIGMRSIQVEVNNRQIIDIAMEQDITGIDEVVVVGYGVQRRVNLSGAVESVDAKQLQNRPLTNLAQGLQGVAPNLNIDFVSGEPGQTARFNIRGVTSINGGDPLIIIDGVPSSPWELNRLTPEDVADISVLKDAASAAIYGARAAFGVVLITTKTGNKEGIYTSYNNNFSWAKPSVLPDKFSDPYVYMRLQDISTNNTPWNYISYSDEMYQWARERSDNPDGTVGVRIDPNNPTRWQYMGNRDWTRYFLDDYTFSQKHHMQIDGKTEKTSYYLSAAFDDETGALKLAEDYFSRYNIRSRVDYKPFNWLTIGNNTMLVLSERRKPSYLDIWNLYNIAPTSYDINPDGTWANSAVGQRAAQLTSGGTHSDKYNSLQSIFTGEARFFDGAFKVNSDYTIRRGNQNYVWNRTKYLIGYGPEDVREVGNNRAWRRAGFDTYNVFNLYSTFNKTFAENHQITALAGFNQESYRWESFDGERGDVISASLPSIALATGEQVVTESVTTWAVRGYFGRLGYIFRDRYIAEFNARYDGTSRFPRTSRYGLFPSASVAWRVDQENFFVPLRHVFSNLKLRTSYGSLGNQNVSAYGYIPTMNAYQANWIVAGQRPMAISTPGLVSDNYSWENVETLNFGVDFGLFADKLSGAFDMYQRRTTGMLTQGKALPGVLGASVPNENAADLLTNGWEVTLTYRNKFNLAGKPFNFDTRLILADSRAWITKFDNPNHNLSDYYVGYEFGQMWGFVSEGYFKSTDEIGALDQSRVVPWGALSIVPGWPKFGDLDGNGIIERGTTLDDTKDLKIIGNSSPRYRIGFNLNFEWNGFDVRTFIQGIGKRDYYPRHYLFWGFYQQPYEGGYRHLLDFYRHEDDDETLVAQHSQAYLDMGLHKANIDGKFPVLQAWLADAAVGNTGLAHPQTGWLLSSAYMRLKNVTVGYTLPRNWTQQVNIDRVRFFVSGENLYEWSEVKKYFDPESITDGGQGYQYPFQRRYSFGVNINF